jgi:SAM-dependent methyltransferase
MKRSLEAEMMDLPGNPKALLEEDLAHLRSLNRYFGNYRNIRRALRQLTRNNTPAKISLLDVGTGSGDIPLAIVAWARQNGIAPAIVGLETEPITLAAAAAQTADSGEVSLVRGDAGAPPFAPRSFDFVLASQLLHHFSEEKIVTLLKTWSQLARRAIIVSDLVRHPVAYQGIRLITRLATRNLMTRTDAPLSVHRAFTLREWRELFSCAGVGRCTIRWVFPFRMLAIITVERSP